MSGQDLPVLLLHFFAGNRDDRLRRTQPKQFEFIPARVVVGENLNTAQAGILLIQQCDGLEILLRVIDPRQNWAAQHDAGAGAIKEIEVGENQLVAYAGPPPVIF